MKTGRHQDEIRRGNIGANTEPRAFRVVADIQESDYVTLFVAAKCEADAALKVEESILSDLDAVDVEVEILDVVVNDDVDKLNEFDAKYQDFMVDVEIVERREVTVLEFADSAESALASIEPDANWDWFEVTSVQQVCEECGEELEDEMLQDVGLCGDCIGPDENRRCP